MKNKKGYIVSYVEDIEDPYIPFAQHIERDDELMIIEDDEKAGIIAEQDGIKLINDIPNIYKHSYIDTPENRTIIYGFLAKNPSYAEQ